MMLGAALNIEPSNAALNPTPFNRWTLRDDAAQRHWAIR